MIKITIEGLKDEPVVCETEHFVLVTEGGTIVRADCLFMCFVAQRIGLEAQRAISEATKGEG